MANSIIYSAVIVGIMSSLPAVRVKLVVFDTSVVDLTHLAHDPVEVLPIVQLGGGTDIGRAVRYCETLVSNPRRTVFALISDFEEGAPPAPLLAAVQRLSGGARHSSGWRRSMNRPNRSMTGRWRSGWPDGACTSPP